MRFLERKSKEEYRPFQPEDKLAAPCENAVKTVLPAIKAAVSIILHEKYGLSENQIARILGLTPMTVSNYIRRKRAGSILRLILSIPKLRREAEELADVIICARKNKKPITAVSSMLCSLCKTVIIYIEKYA